MQPYLIFSDLDGTMLDHDTYSFAPCLCILQELRRKKIPLILNSSKTVGEIQEIRNALHNNDPFVVENGAAIFIPGGIFDDYRQPLNKIDLSTDYKDIVRILSDLKNRFDFPFVGFSDLDIDDIEKLTGLDSHAATLAKQRTGSEPLLWHGTKNDLEVFKKMLFEQRLKLLRGGRFFHVQGVEADKAHAMQRLIHLYQKAYRIDFTSLALGDSQNDRQMLEQADWAGVVRSASGTWLALNKADQKTVYTRQRAPEGWREAVEALFNKIDRGNNHE
ncbi:MAG: mannosyl-3-phosphoglycerate phosphatase-related protein [Methylomicrobium sp.]